MAGSSNNLSALERAVLERAGIDPDAQREHSAELGIVADTLGISPADLQKQLNRIADEYHARSNPVTTKALRESVKSFYLHLDKAKKQLDALPGMLFDTFDDGSKADRLSNSVTEMLERRRHYEELVDDVQLNSRTQGSARRYLATSLATLYFAQTGKPVTVSRKPGADDGTEVYYGPFCAFLSDVLPLMNGNLPGMKEIAESARKMRQKQPNIHWATQGEK